MLTYYDVIIRSQTDWFRRLKIHVVIAVWGAALHGRRLVAEFWGTEQISRTKFLVNDSIFSVLCLSLYCVKSDILLDLHNMIFIRINTLMWPFSLPKTYISEQRLPRDFLVSSYFASHPITTLLEILGDGCMDRPPPQTLGAVPPIPLSLRPWCLVLF